MPTGSESHSMDRNENRQANRGGLYTAAEIAAEGDRSSWQHAQQRVLQYLDGFPVDPVERLEIARQALTRAREGLSTVSVDQRQPVKATMRALRDIIADRLPVAQCPAGTPMAECQFFVRREDVSSDKNPAGGPPSLPILPPLNRGHMRPEPGPENHRSQHRRHHWGGSAFRRRMLLLLLIGATTILASGYMAYVLPYQGRNWLEVVLLVFFSMLFAWISIGFWTSLMGFFMLLGKSIRWKVGPHPSATAAAGDILPKTAIIMPIYNEDTQRVFAGMDAIYTSLRATGNIAAFDFFVLSDSTDPDLWIQEEIAWHELCLRLNAFGRIFYRHRAPNIKRKSGNIADFCRRWGRSYPYMIVLDADSLMAGETMVKMVRLMEQHPDIGILQTPPMLVGKNSLLARVQQFTNHMYGAMFAAGLHFWQLGDAQYWGHNAIIRVAPFMQHCALPRLSGRPPLGGDILSHDFVEAAMMRRAGWGVWLAYDMDGSYEEPPSSLIEEMQRDRRWCQGNIQHLRLLLTRGLMPAHRYLFLNGAMSYISALLWFCFLSLSTAEALSMVLFVPNYFPREGSLFPDWPVWDPSWLIILLVSTMIVLFLPKLLGVILTLISQGRARGFGGGIKAFLSFLGEVLISALLAPIRMLIHSKFVAVTLLGGKIGWTPPNRDERETGWKAAIRFHGAGSLLALVWGAVVYWINPGFFWWIAPILVPLFLAAPVSVVMSKASVGERLRRWGLFLAPPEKEPPAELAAVKKRLHSESARLSSNRSIRRSGFARVVVEPEVLYLHSLVRRGNRRFAASIVYRRRQLIEKALGGGPGALSQPEKKQLLNDVAGLRILHERVWALPAGAWERHWGL